MACQRRKRGLHCALGDCCAKQSAPMRWSDGGVWCDGRRDEPGDAGSAARHGVGGAAQHRHAVLPAVAALKSSADGPGALTNNNGLLLTFQFLQSTIARDLATMGGVVVVATWICMHRMQFIGLCVGVLVSAGSNAGAGADGLRRLQHNRCHRRPRHRRLLLLPLFFLLVHWPAGSRGMPTPHMKHVPSLSQTPPLAASLCPYAPPAQHPPPTNTPHHRLKPPYKRHTMAIPLTHHPSHHSWPSARCKASSPTSSPPHPSTKRASCWPTWTPWPPPLPG